MTRDYDVMGAGTEVLIDGVKATILRYQRDPHIGRLYYAAGTWWRPSQLRRTDADDLNPLEGT